MMSHVGKFYPLLDRRDLCLGCTNHNRSFGRSYAISCTIVTSASPATIVNTRFEPAELISPAWSSQPTWRTKFLHDHGREFRYTQFLDGWDFEKQLTFVRIQIHDATDLRMELRLRNTAPGFASIFPGSFAQYTPLYFDHAYWGGFFSSGQCDTGAIQWRDL